MPAEVAIAKCLAPRRRRSGAAPLFVRCGPECDLRHLVTRKHRVTEEFVAGHKSPEGRRLAV